MNRILAGTCDQRKPLGGLADVAAHGGAIPPRPVALAPLFENFPEELRNRPGWLVWRYELRKDQRGRYKWTKPPRNARSGEYADVSDPSTWATFGEARDAYERSREGEPAALFDGVGIVLTDGLAGLDLDKRHITRGFVLSDLAREALTTLRSYAESSPSATGLRLFVLGELPPGRRVNKALDLELYDCGRYLTVTGRHVHGAPWRVLPRGDELAAFHAKYLPEIVPPAPVRAAPTLHAPAPAPLPSDAEILAAAFASKHGEAIRRLYSGDGGDDPSADDQALVNHLAYWSWHDRATVDRLFRASARMRPKWDDKRGESTYGGLTLDKAMNTAARRPVPLLQTVQGGAR